MTLQLYSAILTALQQIRADVSAQAGDQPGPDGRPGTIEKAAYPQVQRALEQRLAQVEATLRGAGYDDHRRQVLLFPLVLFADEVVLRRVRRDEITSWPLLQWARYRIAWGGERFFEVLEAQLREPSFQLAEAQAPPAEGPVGDPQVVLEALALTLNEGFQGRCADDPAALQRYRERIRAVLPPPPPPATPEPAPEPAPLPLLPRSAALWLLYLAVLAVVAATPWLLVWASNRGASGGAG